LADAHEFQVHLVSGRVSWAGLNRPSAPCVSFFGVTLGRPELPERIPDARQPRRLPVVLSAEEVVRFLEAVPGVRNRAALTTAYAAGLPAAEAARLK
jgi:integrase/recombinase XerD